MPTPLPKADDPEVQRMANQDANYLSAYDICLEYEAELSTFENKWRHVRILGFLLLHAPTQGVRSEMASCIQSRKGSSDPSDVGAFFERNVIFPFKKNKGRTQKTSENSSKPSLELTKDVTWAPRGHQDAKARALIRDEWRCVVTGFIDRKAPMDIIAKLDTMAVGVNTHCVHIIPESTYFGVDPDNRKLDYSTSIPTILKRFHCDIGQFNGEKVHSLTNALSMEFNAYDAFDRLELYFEATSLVNHYEIKWYWPAPPNLRQFVTLSTPDPANLPVPSAELLALHATCCEVAHLSGASEYIDNIYRDADEIGVLSADGTSGDILSYMLLSLSNHLSVQR